MGPKEEMPGPPDFEWMRASDSHRHVSKTFEHCNWLQALEGGLDTSHSSHLHNENLKDKGQWRQRDKAPLIEVETTDYGYCYASLRNAGDDGIYVRFYQYIMPVQQQRGAVTGRNGRNAVPKLNGHLWVPVDDEHTFVYNTSYVIDPETSLPPVDETNSGARSG